MAVDQGRFPQIILYKNRLGGPRRGQGIGNHASTWKSWSVFPASMLTPTWSDQNRSRSVELEDHHLEADHLEQHGTQ